MRCVVFLGPSLPLATARALLDVEYRPPARKGDIYRLLGTDVDEIALIDGVFHGEPAVWQRELVDAIDEGIHVHGASSMGALRAAELHRHGMHGHGTVFAWYRDGVIDGDDEVALRHGAEDDGHRPLSEPLVNIRGTLDHVVAQGLLPRAEADALLTRAKRTYYPQRSYRALAAGDDALARLLLANRRDLKGADARALLARLAAAPARRLDGPGARVDEFERERLLHRVLGAGASTGAEVLARAEANGDLAAIVAAETERWFVLAWAREVGVRGDADAARTFISRWEADHGVRDRDAWRRPRGLTAREYERALEERALEAWLVARGPAAFGVDDFVDAWARRHGLALPRATLLAGGPQQLGYLPPAWDVVVAALRHLQLTAPAAMLGAPA